LNSIKLASRSPQTSAGDGLNRLKTAVKPLSGRMIDRRTAVGRTLEQWRNDLLADLGGREAVSVQERAIVDLAVRTKLLLDSIDAWLLVQPSLVDKRHRCLLPVVRERTQLADALSRYLGQLGLKRRNESSTTLIQQIRNIKAALASAVDPRVELEEQQLAALSANPTETVTR